MNLLNSNHYSFLMPFFNALFMPVSTLEIIKPGQPWNERQHPDNG